MTLKIPWWGKIGAKLLLSRLPFGYTVWQRFGLFRHGQMDTSQYAISIFNSHIEKTGLANRLVGKTVLELGPGDSIATAIIAKAHGACGILVDTGGFVRSDIGPYLELIRALTQQGLAPPDLSACRTIYEILGQCGAQYMTEGLKSLAQIESNSVDLIFSQAVLEHVSKKQFRATMQECRRILRPNGICSHQVDLRDHLGGALNNLRFSHSVWESNLFVKSGFYTNRLRFSQMLQLFSDVGFTVEVTDVRRWRDLPTKLCQLALEFKDMPNEELCISGFHVLLR